MSSQSGAQMRTVRRQVQPFSRLRWAVLSGAVGLVVASVGLAVAPTAATATAPCGNGVLSTSGTQSTCTYTSLGEDAFSVPAGVTVLKVLAVGASGDGAGGGGAQVTAQLSVAEGAPLVVEVGVGGGAGGAGTGTLPSGGAGGGSSGVRSCGGTTTACALVVAGGGGGRSGDGRGGGHAGTDNAATGASCAPGVAGEVLQFESPAAGGQGGGCSAGGSGGAYPVGACKCPTGGGGASGLGGAGGGGGGGGGGGYFGGGGGAGSPDDSTPSSTGGGGGSSFVGNASQASLVTSQTAAPKVTLTWTSSAPDKSGPTTTAAPSRGNVLAPTTTTAFGGLRVAPTTARVVPHRAIAAQNGPAAFTLSAAGTMAGGAHVRTTVKNAINVGLVVMDADAPLTASVGVVPLGHVDPGARTLPWDLHVDGRTLAVGRYLVALEIFGPDNHPSGRAFPNPALLTISPDGHISAVMTSIASRSTTSWLGVGLGVVVGLAVGGFAGLALRRRRTAAA